MAHGFVRPAAPEDAGAIARIQLITWRSSYRRIIPATAAEGIDEDWVISNWHESIKQPPTPRHRVLVAVEQTDQAYPVGFVAAGPADASALAPDELDGPVLDDSVLGDSVLDGSPLNGSVLEGSVAAITDLLVEPRFGRRGHGSRLLAAATELWRGDGFTTALTWCYAGDAAMRSFLTSAGWAADGAAQALDVDDLLVEQIRYRTMLA